MRYLLKLLGHSQKSLWRYLNGLTYVDYEKIVIPDGGIIFTPKGQKQYALMCMHIDTINDARNTKAPAKGDLYVRRNYIALLPNSDCACLGGDDRCGCYIALKLMDRGVPFAFGFFVDEEIGGQGSAECINTIKELNVTSFIGLDRKGSDELALYGYDNQELICLFEAMGYNSDWGSFTDASNLARALGIACVNLSIGYQHEHTHNEFIDFTATLNTLKTLSTGKIIEFLNSKEFMADCDTLGSYYDDAICYGDDGMYYGDEIGFDYSKLYYGYN